MKTSKTKWKLLLYVAFCGYLCFCGRSFAEIENSKNRPFEISPGINMFSADTFRSNFAASLQANYRINETYWVGLGAMYGILKLDQGQNIPDIDTRDRLKGIESVFYFNVPGLLGNETSGNRVDLFTSLGCGYYFFGDQGEIVGLIGGGMTIHFEIPWIALRFDLKNYLYVLNNPQGSNFNSDLALVLGPAFLF